MAGIRIAARFEKARGALEGKEAARVADAVLRLNTNPELPAFHLHRVDACGFWSARVGGDLRIILQRGNDGVLTLCYVGHHDDAYAWARRHRLAQHPVTGTMQLVEVPEQSEAPRRAVRATSPARRLGLDETALLALGVPPDWVARVLEAPDADALMDVAEHLSPEAAEAALKIAVGERPEPRPVAEGVTGFETEDAKRAFVIVSDDALVREALEAGWEAWTVFLHPEQRKMAYRDYMGPARVSGSAGTGKTVVALHHAKWLLERNPGRQVLLTTYSQNLAADLRNRLHPLILNPKTRERINAEDLLGFAIETYRAIAGRFPRMKDAYEGEEADFVRQVIQENATLLPKDLPVDFAYAEWSRVVDVRDLHTWEAYRDAKRRGVTRRLSEPRRKALWTVFECVHTAFAREQCLSRGELFGWLAQWLTEHPGQGRAYDYVIVDEAQDLGEVELRFLAAYATRPDTLFFAGDVGQRVHRYAFSWEALGISVRGRSRTLKVNYRTAHEIRELADRLLDDDNEDPDGEKQSRRGTISVVRGAKPEIRTFPTQEAECAGVAAWLDTLKARNFKAREIAIFYRDEAQRSRALAMVRASAYRDCIRRQSIDLHLCTMVEAKGLEYRAVAVIACDGDIIPSPKRLAENGFISNLGEIYETERNLLYVACTRARDVLLITAAGSPSEFLMDLANPALT